MFTLKFYTVTNDPLSGSQRIRIEQADSVSVLRDEIGAEITMHRHVGDDIRLDIGFKNVPRSEEFPQTYDRVIIENAAGKTTQILSY